MREGGGIVFGIVHNEESERIAYLKNHLLKIEKIHPDRLLLESTQVLQPMPFMTLLRRQKFHLLYVWKWLTYLEQKRLRVVLKELMFLAKIFFKSSERSVYTMRSAIEWAITKKHLQIVRRFQELDFKYLLVLESDAIFRPELAGELNAILEKALCETEAVCENSLIWMRVGSGFNMQEIGGLPFKTKIKSTNLHFFSKPFTNTSCAYLMSFELAKKILLNFDSGKTRQRYEPIDFFYNRALMEIQDLNQICSCDFESPPIIHGSLMGVTKSWQN